MAARLSGDQTLYDSLSYSYDAAGRLHRVRDVFGDEFRYGYDAHGRVDTLHFPLGQVKTVRYDGDSRPIEWRHDRPGATPPWSQTLSMRYDGRDKVMVMDAHGCAQAVNSYTGLGQVRKALWDADCFEGDHTEYWTTDALGNLTFNNDTWRSSISTSSSDLVHGNYLTRNTYQPGTGRIVSMAFSGGHHYPQRDCLAEGCSGADILGSGANRHDPGGNLYFTAKSSWTSHWRYDVEHDHTYRWTENRKVGAATYFGADDMTRVVDKRSTDTEQPTNPGFGFPAFEEYRYDAFGRRVLRRSRDAGACADAPKCLRQLVQRFIWDGNSLLAEIQYPGGDGVSVDALERDTVTITNNSSRYWGRVLYVNGLDLDQPLAAIRIGFGILTGGPTYDTGPSFEAWDPLVIAPVWGPRGDPSGAAFYGPTAESKANGARVEIAFPYALPFGAPSSANAGNKGFFGSLLLRQRDGTGKQYMRARYYDPETGRFTQEDPAGLAGGLNLYGFANGDPINLSDPFGLIPLPLLILAAYALFEAGSTGYDVYEAGRTLADENASASDKALTSGGALIGLWTPGPGTLYVRAGRSIARFAETMGGIRRQLANIKAELGRFDHLRTARLENTGRLTTRGNHVKELTSFSNGLRASIERLKRLLADPDLTDEGRAEAIRLLRELSILRDQIQRALR